MPPSQPRHFLRADANFRVQALQQMPWLADWVGPAPTPRRSPLDAPYTCTTLGLPRQQAHAFVQGDPPWVALRKFAQLRFLGLASSLCTSTLDLAIVYNNPEDVREALRSGESASARGPSGLSSLSLAALLGRQPIIKILMNAGAPPNEADELGNTALHWAAMVNDTPMLQLLVARGAVDQRNVLGGLAQDTVDAWAVRPLDHLDVEVQPLTGPRRRVHDPEEFTRLVGCAYMPTMRPCIDYCMHILVHLGDATWRRSLLAELRRFPPLPFLGLVEAPVYFRDFGPPLNWGICAAEDLEVGQPVTTYAGELVHTLEALVQNFNGDFNPYALAIAPSEALSDLLSCVCDPRHCGGVGSRINGAHAESAANLTYECGLWRGLPVSQFSPVRPVRRDEQLFWFYGEGYWAGHPTAPVQIS